MITLNSSKLLKNKLKSLNNVKYNYLSKTQNAYFHKYNCLKNLNPFEKSDNNSNNKNEDNSINSVFFKTLETSLTTIATILMFAFAGYGYHKYYNHLVAKKVSNAFDGVEFNSVLDRTLIKRRESDIRFNDIQENNNNNNNNDNNTNNDDSDFVHRPEQDLIDKIVSGELVGRYYLILGEKGTGKMSMVTEAIKKINGFNCSLVEAHADPEIFRIRLGKAINFSFYEDYIGSLFSIRGPRDTTAILDIERAFNMLENVATQRRSKIKKPLILVISATHLFRHNEIGQDLVELIQQKAEEFSASGLMTIIFSSDDYWVYERLKTLGTRLEVITVKDVDLPSAISILKKRRYKYFKQDMDNELAKKIYNLVGGRPQHLNKVAQFPDMLSKANEILHREKMWFLNQCGLLGMNMDDDVMESGKFSTSANLLAKAFVELDDKRLSKLKSSSLNDNNNTNVYDCNMPEIPLWLARVIMTRPDYIQKYDSLNIFTIDSRSMVRPDSCLMMHAFKEIVKSPGYEKLLQDTIERVSAIESLQRTRELVAKDLVLGGKYYATIEKNKLNNKDSPRIVIEASLPEEQEDEEYEAASFDHGLHDYIVKK